MDLQTLQENLRKAWDASTSVSPHEWSEDNSALGQCAVTALVIQDYFGGDLQRSKINGESHYWVRLPNGEDVDITKEQFATIESETLPELRTRDYVLSFSDTMRRYEILKAKLKSLS